MTPAEPLAARPKILLVDDDEADLRSVETELAVLEVDLVTARSGRDAHRATLEGDFALILLDAQMPELDGFQTATLIRGHERARLVPIIFISAENHDHSHNLEGYRVGAVDLIRKPVDARVLRSKVNGFVDLYRAASRVREQSEELARREMDLIRREGERRYKDLAESMPQIVWTADATGRFTYRNQHWFSIAKKTSSPELSWQDILHPDDLARFEREWVSAIERRDGFSGDFRFGTQDRWHWHLVRVIAQRDELDAVVSFVGTANDIDVRREAEESLRILAAASIELARGTDVEAALAAVADLAVPHACDALIIDLLEGSETKRIAIACADSSRTKEIAASFPAAPWQHASGSGRFATTRAASDGALAHTLDGLGFLSMTCVPCESRGKRFGYLTALSRTAHENPRLLEDLARRAAGAIEIARTFAEVERERANLAEANRAKDEFLAILSHELRTPINVVLGWTQLLRAGTLPATSVKKALETIERNTRSQAQLVADLLDVSRIISGKLRVERGPVDLAEVVAVAIDALRPSAIQKGVALEAALDKHVGMVFGDRERLTQVVANLVSNALKFTPSPGVVLVTLTRERERAKLVVKDSGQGIESEFLPHVFDRFRQAESGSSRRHGGLGLGLAIVTHLVKIHGGLVSAASDGRGKGSTFTVELPILAGPAEAVPWAKDERLARSPQPRALVGVRVLLVDDEADGRTVAKEMIALAGADVHAVASAADALAAIEETSPHVIVSDIGMPDRDGYSLIQEIRARPRASGGTIPAIALTAYASNEDAERALAAGFDAHLTKPVDPGTLQKTLVAVLAKAI